MAKNGDQRDGAARRCAAMPRSANDSAHRRRGGEHVAGDDDQRHLQREWNQLPEAAFPRHRSLAAGVDGVSATPATITISGGDEREDESIGHPPLGPLCQCQRYAREDSCLRGRVRVCCGARVRALHRESALERDVERCAGLGADVFHGDAGMQLGEDEPATLFYFKHAQIGDDEINHAEPGDRQRALFQNLRAAVLAKCVPSPPRRASLRPRDPSRHRGL